MSDINFFGETTFRNVRKKFGIKPDDRRRHVYVIGKTGMGKTAMLQNMAIQDIQNGKGIGFVDPHGEAAEELLDFIPSNRVNDVVYFNPADLNYPIAFNVMEKVDIEHRHLVAGGLMGVFKKIWPDVWSARMEYILNNAILALLEYPGSTLLGINRMLSDPEYREKVVGKITDPVIKAFWINEYARYTQRYEVEATGAIQNKVGQFISAPLIRNIIGQVKSAINIREIMDKEKILILNLSKGRIGEDNSMLLGALLITKIQLAAMSRVDMPEKERKDFFLYVDEFQNFATESFTNILSEARKYRLALILAHQYIAQMDEKVRDAAFGNVGTIISFRIGAEDAEFIEKEFSPQFLAGDLVNLSKYNIYLKLMIDGLAGRPFSAATLLPFPSPEESYREKIIKVSREKYATPRIKVEESITKWAGFLEGRSPVAPPKETPVLYDAKCSMCHKETKVTFPPDGKRPVYCKSCLKKVRAASGPIQQIPRMGPSANKERLGGDRPSDRPTMPERPNRPSERPTRPSETSESPTRPSETSESPTREPTPSISLREAVEESPVSFGGKTKRAFEPRERKRKTVDLDGLKKTLEETLGNIKKNNEE